MKVKISEYTPYLLVGLLIVVIARHFYNPLQLVDMWEVVQEGEEMSMFQDTSVQTPGFHPDQYLLLLSQSSDFVPDTEQPLPLCR